MVSINIAQQRREQLLEMIRLRGFASLPDLAEELEVSESTIRRDLETLEADGRARRTHGGAFYSGPTPKLPHFDRRQAAQWEKKKQIARRASELIDDGDTVLLDGGSTTYEVAQCLVGRPLQVVTNSLPVANLFSGAGEGELVMIGGYLHGSTGVSIGPYATQMLAGLNVRRTILSVGGVSDQGYYNSNLLLVEVEQAMMQVADEVIIVADSTKFGHKSLAKMCGLGDVQHLVVDHEISEDWRSKIIAAGVKLSIAGTTDNA